MSDSHASASRAAVSQPLDESKRVGVVDASGVVLDDALTKQAPPAALMRTQAASAPAHATPVIVFDAERTRILKDTIMPSASDVELDFFSLVCKRTGLDPFAKQIHAVKRSVSVKKGNSWVKEDRWSFQVAIDGFRLIAERTGKYRGQTLPLFCGVDGVWHEVWLSTEPPRAAKVGVLRSDFDEPLYAVALWDEYVQTKDEYDNGEKTGRKTPNAMWAKMPSVMIAKVAEALALRKAFPQEMSGLYTDDEMAQADSARSDDDDTSAQQRRHTRGTRQTASGETASVAHNGAAAATQSTSSASAEARNFDNGTSIVFPYGPLRDLGATLDAVYHAGATRTRKKKGQPAETIECGGQFVVADARLIEAHDWAKAKLDKHRVADSLNETTSPDYISDESSVDRLIDWLEALNEEGKRRVALVDAKLAHDDDIAARSEGENRPNPTSTNSSTTSAATNDSESTPTTTQTAPAGKRSTRGSASTPAPDTTTTSEQLARDAKRPTNDLPF